MRLDVWLEALDHPVGTLVRAPDKSLAFSYSRRTTREGRLSLSMPRDGEDFPDAACAAFFGNLLFESGELDRVCVAHGLDRDDIGGLLLHLGADCPGAVSVTPEGSGPGKKPGRFPDDYELLDDARLDAIIRNLHLHGRLPEGARAPSPVAGVQPKIACVFHGGEFFLPRAGTRAPTTHILKVSPRDDRLLTKYEAALLAGARKVGLDVVETAYRETSLPGLETPVGMIVSTRFDRTFDGSRIGRIHAEDLCQALGLPRRLKYERSAVTPDRSFNAAAVGRIARETAAPAKFQIAFLRQTLYNLAVGNSDNHGKNATILYRTPDGELAPLYDVVPVTMDPHVTHELAFNIGGASYAEDLTAAAIERFMADIGFRKPKFDDRWKRLLRGVASAGIDVCEGAGGKPLADAVAAQIGVLETALGETFNAPDRDYHPRNVRDVSPAGIGGWTLSS